MTLKDVLWVVKVQHSRVQLELMQRQSDQIQRQQQQQYEEQHQRLEQQELLMQYRQCLQYGQPVEAERGVSGGTGCCTCKVGCRSVISLNIPRTVSNIP